MTLAVIKKQGKESTSGSRFYLVSHSVDKTAFSESVEATATDSPQCED